MKTFSLTTIITSTSLIVGICSVLLFAYRQHVLEFALSLSSTTGSILQTINIIKSSSSTTTLPEDTPLSNVPTLAVAQQQEEEEAEQTPTPTTITISSSPSSSSSSDMSSAAKRLILNPRVIRKAVLAVETPEGAGARVRRSIGTAALRNFTPFLMLDHFHASSEAGFPDHPHRGQETITYLIQGGLDHEDFAGNKGTLNSGDLQFMTAGRGIMHSEMPRQNADGTPNVGLQLWVDLPKELKYCEPRYRDLRAHEIPVVESDDGKVKVKVISGEHAGVESVKDLAYTPVVYYDVEVKPGGRVEQKIPEGFSAFVYILEGEVVFGQGGEAGEGQEKKIGQYHNVVFGDEGDGIVARVEDSETSKPARFVIIGGKKLDQPVVQYGPFVLNSQDEVYQAFVDYQSHSNGFERAKGWRSEIGKRMIHH